MADREKVIEGLRCIKGDLILCVNCAYSDENGHGTHSCKAFCANDAIALLKEQEGYVSVPFSWLVKFCTHIDFVEPLTDAEREVAWRQKLMQQFGINASKKAVRLDG